MGNTVSTVTKAVEDTYNKVAKFITKTTNKVVDVGKVISNVVVDSFEYVRDDLVDDIENYVKNDALDDIKFASAKFAEFKNEIEDTVIDIAYDNFGDEIEAIESVVVPISQKVESWALTGGKVIFKGLSVVYEFTTDVLVDLGVPRSNINKFNSGVSAVAYTGKQLYDGKTQEVLEKLLILLLDIKVPTLQDFNKIAVIKQTSLFIKNTSNSNNIEIYKNGPNGNMETLIKNSGNEIPILLLQSKSLDNYDTPVDNIPSMIANYCRVTSLALGVNVQTSNLIAINMMLACLYYMKQNMENIKQLIRSGKVFEVIQLISDGASGALIKNLIRTSNCGESVQNIASFVSLLVSDILRNSNSILAGVNGVNACLERVEVLSNKNAKLQGCDIKLLQELSMSPRQLLNEGYDLNTINNSEYFYNDKISKKSLANLKLKSNNQNIFDVVTTTNSYGIKCYVYKLKFNITWEDIAFPNDIESKYASFNLYDGDRFNGNNKIIKINDSTNGIFSNGFTGFQKADHLNVIHNLGVEGGKITAIGGGFLYRQNQKFIEINNCFSTGYVDKKEAGGIVGKTCYNAVIQKCYSRGKISGEFSGGISGAFFGSQPVSTITNKQLTTNPTLYFNRITNKSEILNCYSLGTITATGGGGISGGYSGFGALGNACIRMCYSTGNIDGVGSGGISGSNCANDNGLIRIDSVFTLGSILGIRSGGIIGEYVSMNNGRFVLTNSYTTGYMRTQSRDKINGGLIGFSKLQNNYTQHQQVYPAVNNIYIPDILSYESKASTVNKQFLGTIRNCISCGSNNNEFGYYSVIGLEKAYAGLIKNVLNIQGCYGNYRNNRGYLSGNLFHFSNVYNATDQRRLVTNYVVKVDNRYRLLKKSSFYFLTNTSSSTTSTTSTTGNTQTTTNLTKKTHVNYFYLKDFKNNAAWNASTYNKQIERPKLTYLPTSNLSNALPSNEILLSIIDTVEPIYNLDESELLNNIQIRDNKVDMIHNDITVIRCLVNGTIFDINNDYISNNVNDIDLFVIDNETEKLERLIIKLSSNEPHKSNTINGIVNLIMSLDDITQNEKYTTFNTSKGELAKLSDHFLTNDVETNKNILKYYKNGSINLNNRNILVELTNNIELTDTKRSLLDNNLLNIMVEPNNIVNIKYNGKSISLELYNNMVKLNGKSYSNGSIINIHGDNYRIIGLGSVLLEKVENRNFGLFFGKNDNKGNSKFIGSKYGLLNNRRR
jgi:hypothetical protein